MINHENQGLQKVSIDHQPFFKIPNSDHLRPFLMSIVSDTNHWLYVSSNGGLTAGRKNSEFALFPYYTDDKLTENAETTGPKTIIRVKKDNTNKHVIWEPFSIRQKGQFHTEQNLYKSVFCDSVIFEEINHDLQLTYRYRWSTSNLFGFVRTSTLINEGTEQVSVKIADGLQNILPYGVESDLQHRASNLVDAYKRCELHAQTGLGIYALSAIIVDKAEPSEALKANIVWSMGLATPRHLLSTLQLDAFRRGDALFQEEDIKGEKGAYFIVDEFTLPSQKEKSWRIVANVNQTHANIAALLRKMEEPETLAKEVDFDIKRGVEKLIALVSSADGMQHTADERRDARHFSNVLYNCMRGGVIDHNYTIEKADFTQFLKDANAEKWPSFKVILDDYGETFTYFELIDTIEKNNDVDFQRLAKEYLPIRFSRRHGDPSRPWNKFSINTNSEVDGSKILDFEGNWRDIFQNWEALAYSFPYFIENMIFKFVNASTFDGYNPYRVTKDGFDWETIDPEDPWSYIGYWGDHQLIYLLKFLEFIENSDPGRIEKMLNSDCFVYANVPYKIRPYADIVADPKNTIEFDLDADHTIRKLRDSLGADGALLRHQGGEIYHVNFLEKLLATVLCKVSNYIPDAGIWMNTQRPEWNDANNALVGHGVSMVTLYYLRRFLSFLQPLIENTENHNLQVSEEIYDFFQSLSSILLRSLPSTYAPFENSARKKVMDDLGTAACTFRSRIYSHSFTGIKSELTKAEILSFIKASLHHIDHCIHNNRREDGLFHAYNLISIDHHEVTIDHLSEMLEGQVAILSCKYLSSLEAIDMLDALRNSPLYRVDQNSYLLYPNKELPGFLEKNIIPKSLVEHSALLTELVQRHHKGIIEKDVFGEYHFNGNFRNAEDLKKALGQLDESYDSLVAKESERILSIFETVFNHKAFTGRSGTFFGYEGLGSIYWHMVSKLLLAVQECYRDAEKKGESAEVLNKLSRHYYQINEGLGIHKPPSLYGAFPSDAYSHTPHGKGAQQPGMTGQVKEDIICRFGELGLWIEKGHLSFSPSMLRKEEFLQNDVDKEYYTVDGRKEKIHLSSPSIFFSICQTPVVYKMASSNRIIILRDGKEKVELDSLKISSETTESIFRRDGNIKGLEVYINTQMLK